MTLTGAGVLLIGIAFLTLSIFLARVLNQTAFVLKGVGTTIEQLPDQLDGVLEETSNLIGNTNDTLSDVNEKLDTLTPLFHIIGDVGESTRKVTSSVNDFTVSMKGKLEATDEETRNKRLGGMYGLSALAFYSVGKGKELKKRKSFSRMSTLQSEGEQRAFDIHRIKEEAKESAKAGKYVIDDL